MPTPQRFFRLHGVPDAVALPNGLDLEVLTPTLTRLRAYSDEEAPPLALYLFWFLASSARYVVYYVPHQGRIVHFSHVLGRNFKFPFMRKGDLHIGPCWTAPDFRGRRIYPAVLSRIVRDHQGRSFWMLTDEVNVSSQRGIERAGFRCVGTGSKEHGIYRMKVPRQDR